uniref:Uncharacterized protein n=1 Tax=Pararge aegeria TaxID=116150 RepID=S4P180_9NEOP
MSEKIWSLRRTTQNRFTFQLKLNTFLCSWTTQVGSLPSSCLHDPLLTTQIHLVCVRDPQYRPQWASSLARL